MFMLLGVRKDGAAQSNPRPLIGVWRIGEARSGTGKDISEPEVSLYIFTRNHFSIAWSSTDRPVVGGGIPTDSQKVAMWKDFFSQPGTYDVVGHELTLHSVIAKSPQAMKPGESQKYSVTRDGDAIWLQLIATAAGPLTNQERIRLVRLE